MDINYFLNHHKNSVKSVSYDENDRHRAHRGHREEILCALCVLCGRKKNDYTDKKQKSILSVVIYAATFDVNTNLRKT